MSQNNPQVTDAISANAVSIIRTIVPSLWGAAISWGLAQFPALESIQDQLNGLGVILVAIVIGGWYALWRNLEPKLPNWVRVVTLGAAVAPVVYAPKESDISAVQVKKPRDESGAVTKTIDVSGPDGAVIR